MPVIGVCIVLVVALFALRGNAMPGIHGPDIFPGIFRLPKKDKFPIISAPLIIDNVVDAEGAIPTPVPESWRVVLISARDREPMTRAVVLSLAEKLTRHGSVALVDPIETDAFPMGCDRVIGVSTLTATIPEKLGVEGAVTLVVDTRLARLPEDHPAAALHKNPEGPLRHVMKITHRSRADGAIDGWPQWWSGCGRAIAETILAQLAPQGLPPVSDAITHRWLDSLLPRSDWGTPLSLPPTTENLHWDYAFQDDLVRGWVGHITGMVVTPKRGTAEPAVAQLERRMVSGSWQPGVAEGVQLYSRQVKEQTEWFAFAPLPLDAGWHVTWWQERPRMHSVFEDWGTAAAAGDQQAQRLLYAYRLCPQMPPELREQAATLPAAAQVPIPPTK
jgi:hypothetical protein